jgi:hypothetical protein
VERDFTAVFWLTHALPHVLIVGDTTAGASGSPIVRELPNVYEGIGLAPNVAVKPATADAAQGVDAVLERALLLAGTP